MEELRKVKDIFTEIQNVSSIKAKEYILKQNADNELFKECLKFLLDSNIVTGLSTKKMNKDVLLVNETFGDIRDAFKYLEVHNTGTDHDIAIIKSYCYFQGELEDFCKELFTKKLKLGIDTKVVNRVYPNFIREFNIMLADSYAKNEKRITDDTEFILMSKLDGGRICVIKEGDKLLLKTRQNKDYEGLVGIENDFKSLPNGFYDGELLAIGNFENSAEQYKETMKRSRIKGEKHGLKMVCYDYIKDIDEFYSGRCNVKCIDRKKQLKEILSPNKEFVEYLEPLYIGKDKSKILAYSNEAVKNKEEGIMLAVADAPYECKRSKNILKVKQFHDGEVFVTSVYEGEGRLKGKLGGVNAEFIYKGEVQNVSVGSGWSDKDREHLFNNSNEIIGKVISIKLFEISQDSKTKKYSLRFPTVALPFPECIRLDKTTLEETNVE